MTPEEERIKRKIKNDLLREFKIVSGGKNLTHRETMDAITNPPSRQKITRRSCKRLRGQRKQKPAPSWT